MTKPPLPEEIREQIFIDAENLYNLLDEKARDKDHYDFGLPMFEKVKEPIEELLTAYAQRALSLKDALERISSLSDEYPIQVAIDLADAALKIFPEQGEEGSLG